MGCLHPWFLLMLRNTTDLEIYIFHRSLVLLIWSFLALFWLLFSTRKFATCISFYLLIVVWFSRSLNREFFSDTCWTLSMYLEAIAMIPQIYMFQKQAADEGGTVEVSLLIGIIDVESFWLIFAAPNRSHNVRVGILSHLWIGVLVRIVQGTLWSCGKSHTRIYCTFITNWSPHYHGRFFLLLL